MRTKKGMSHEEVAKISEVSYNTIVKIEHGATENPGVKALYEIAKMLDTSLNDLIEELKGF